MDSKGNKDFYQQILQQHETDDSIIIDKFEKTAACDKGDSFVSNVSKVHVFGHRGKEEYQRKIVVKELPPAEQRELFRTNIAMENEIHAYTKVIPALKKYTIDNELPVADFIYGDEKVVVLEDLCAQGYSAVGKSRGGLSLEECEIVLKGLAKFHAASFVLKHEEPEQFEELSKPIKEVLFHDTDSRLLNSQSSSVERACEIFEKVSLSEESKKAADVLQDLKQHSTSKVKDLLLKPAENPVLCYGDAWSSNIMFNAAKELKLIDFQNLRCNSVASDLCYLLYVNLPPKDRTSNIDQLLGGYLDSLREHVKAKGVCLDEVLTKEWLDKEMDTFAIYGLVYGIWILPMFFVKKEDVEISEARINGKTEIPKQTVSEFEERTKDLILDYVKRFP